MLVDRPTQLICISDIYLLTNTNTKDIAGQSAKCSAGGRQAGAGVGDL